MAKNATQRGTVIGKVAYASVGEVKATKNGKEYVDYNFGVKTSSGVMIFNRSRLFNPNDPAPFTADMMAKYDEIVENYSNEDIYVRKGVRPSTDKKTKEVKMSFDTFKCYKKQDGTNAFGTEGNLEVVEHEVVGEEGSEEIVLTMQGMNDTYTRKFSELQTKIAVEMIVKSVDVATREIVLFDGKEDDQFPLTVIGALVEGMDVSGAKVGQGYKFEVSFKKGEKIEATDDSSFNGWESEAKEDVSFAPDSVILTPLGIVKELKAEVSSAPVRQAATFGAPATATPTKAPATGSPALPF